MADRQRFTLGSSSPRRSDLLVSAGFQFDVDVANIDEAALVDPFESDPAAIVARIAQAKFAAFPVDPRQPALLTADTLVACDDTILGKPASEQHLRDMLGHMSGRPVTVVSAVCVGRRGEEPLTEVVSTAVVLRELASREIERYVATGVGMDKAAGLALQAQAKPFISAVDGCWSNVVGLPLCAATRLLGSATRCSVGLCGRHDR